MVHVAGGVVFNPKLGVVVVNQHRNSWSLPKGHIEANENALTAAKREIEEETGIPASELTLVEKVSEYERARIKLHPEDADEIRHVTLFLFITRSVELCPTDPENPEARWVAPDNVPNLLTHPVDKAEFQRMIETNIFNRQYSTQP